jgi:hypothetical protein
MVLSFLLPVLQAMSRDEYSVDLHPSLAGIDLSTIYVDFGEFRLSFRWRRRDTFGSVPDFGPLEDRFVTESWVTVKQQRNCNH